VTDHLPHFARVRSDSGEQYFGPFSTLAKGVEWATSSKQAERLKGAIVLIPLSDPWSPVSTSTD
jgi:hypothetical protein